MAGEHNRRRHSRKTVRSSAPGLEKIQALEGDGIDPEGQVVSSFRIPADGAAVAETVFPGTVHEMLTVYDEEGDDLMLTHFWVLGNRPLLRGRGTGGKAIVFECAENENASSENESHMHRGRITGTEEDHITTEWRQVEPGANHDTARFELERWR